MLSVAVVPVLIDLTLATVGAQDTVLPVVLSALAFVMRDCPIPIDIIFLDGSGRILSWHAMQPEEARKPGEDPNVYESRLKKYSSRFPCQFAVELAGGTLKGLSIKEGEMVRLGVEELKKRAR